MKTTAFLSIHEALGARLVEFAGYKMPVVYSSIKEEHLNIRNNVGVFDVSHMGEFMVSGPHAHDLVQYVTTNDIDRLQPGAAQYSCLPNEQGGIVDDLLVYFIAKDRYLLVVNASNIEKDWNWIVAHNQVGAQIENESDQIAQLAVQGPNAIKVLQKLTRVPLDEIEYYHFTYGPLAGVENVLISATGYTGSGGVELYFPNKYAKQVWEAIFDAGKAFGTEPAGLGARDTLRLEMGFCLYGNDINENTSPLEAGLGWITKLKAPGNKFINKDFFIRQKEAGLKRKLIGFELIDRGIPRHDYRILNHTGSVIGRVTSGTQSPLLNKAIGMGYVDLEHSKTGSEIFIEVRNKALKAIVQKTPFYKQA